jgi:hypothetical protein
MMVVVNKPRRRYALVVGILVELLSKIGDVIEFMVELLIVNQ